MLLLTFAVAAEGRELADLGEESVEQLLALERGDLPLGVEVAVADELPGGSSQELAGGGLFAALGSAPQQSSDALRGLAERGGEPAIEGGVEEGLRLGLLGHVEERVDTGLDGMLAEEIGAERVDGADAGDLELSRAVSSLSFSSAVA